MTDIPAPNVHIQWKGTNVCATLHCSCGTDGHIDAEFAYNVRCEACDRLYEMPHTFPVRLGDDQGDGHAEAPALPGDGGDHRQLYVDNAAQMFAVIEQLARGGYPKAVELLLGVQDVITGLVHTYRPGAKEQQLKAIADGYAVRCPRCGWVSYNPKDVAEGYCGVCHDWTGEPAP